jgi:hypothetical protein
MSETNLRFEVIQMMQEMTLEDIQRIYRLTLRLYYEHKKVRKAKNA